jgi:hypothetical protein
MSDLLFDTCFLIDVERELRRGGGPAHGFHGRSLVNSRRASAVFPIQRAELF